MTLGAGVLRSGASLDETQAAVDDLAAEIAAGGADDTATDEVRNLLDMGGALLAAARQRAESRGAHTRSDRAGRDDDHFRLRLVLSR
jgi:L-aspartate oxidase